MTSSHTLKGGVSKEGEKVIKMDSKEAFNRLTKEQVIHLIIWQMFTKQISLDELTKRIKEKELEIVEAVNQHLNEVNGRASSQD